MAELEEGNGFIGDESDEEEALVVAEYDDEEDAQPGDYSADQLALEEIQRELLELAELSDAGYDIDEKRFDYLLKAQEENPLYQLMLEEERRNWRESLAEFLEQCLERTRTFVPVNIFESTFDSLVGLGLSDDLARRLQQRQCLWLVRMGKDEIARLHESDLLGRFNSQQQHLDIIETAAVYASLPEEFRFDPNGRKKDWRLTIEDNLRQMLLDNDQDALPVEKIRNPSYEGRQYGPITDVVSVRSVEVHKAGDGRESRRSFMAICKEHSLMGKMRALSRRRSRSTEHNVILEEEHALVPESHHDDNIIPPSIEEERTSSSSSYVEQEEIETIDGSHHDEVHVDQLSAAEEAVPESESASDNHSGTEEIEQRLQDEYISHDVAE